MDIDVQSCEAVSAEVVTFARGNKFFELSNHLGKVLATVSDKKVGHSFDGTSIDHYTAEVVSTQDYYPFGMMMPGRKYSIANTEYRYGFGGHEKDDEAKGSGNHLAFLPFFCNSNIEPVTGICSLRHRIKVAFVMNYIILSYEIAG